MEHMKKHLQMMIRIESVDSYMMSYDEKILFHGIQLGLKNKTRIAEIMCQSSSI